MKIELKCVYCENLFSTDFKHRDKKFCNRSCYFDHARVNKTLGRPKDPNVKEERECVRCGNKFTERIKYERKLCSNKCRLIWNSTETNKSLRIDKSRKVLLEKYGKDTIFKLDEFKKNRVNLFSKKYGVSHPMLVTHFVEKLQNTLRRKHLLNLLPKLKEKNIELIDEYKCNKSGSTSQVYNFKCNSCENIFSSTVMGSGKIPICRKCYPITKNSKLEQIIKDFLNVNNITHIDSDRKILNGKEIDIYLPNYNIGIEINGNYYHSEIGGDKTKHYHIEKTKLSDSKNITLIHFYEDEILLKPNIVFSKLSSKLNLNNTIYGRKCVLKEITKKESTIFLNKNHLQGNTIDKIRYGLFYNGELVSVMTFGKKRKSLGNNSTNIGEYELVRFCNKQFINVIGGFSKLLKHFIKINDPSKIETFADIRWSGIDPLKTVYSKNGFTYLRQTPPNYWYIKTDKYLNRYHRFSFRKDVLVKEGYDKKMTEWNIMQLKGYDRIWDCGSLKFELNILN